jgi:hypothetical protein
MPLVNSNFVFKLKRDALNVEVLEIQFLLKSEKRNIKIHSAPQI